MFRHEIDPFPVHDTVVFRNVDAKLTLKVRADDKLLVVNLSKANKRLSTLKDDTPEEDKKSVCMFFAGAIFGEDQAEELLHFYNDDPLAVVVACGKYFNGRLGKLITKAQKRK